MSMLRQIRTVRRSSSALDTEKLGPGLSEDIAYALGRLKRWVCQDCGCVNGAHEAFCYRCGAGFEDCEDDA